jgi:hypothetical protein
MAALARELGLSWQRLWTMLYQPPGGTGFPACASATGKNARATKDTWPALQVTTGAHSLVERYRPTRLEAIWGQEAVVEVLSKFAKDPYSTAFIFEGYTGTGKTSAALALAAAVGCDLSQKEFGGVHVIASGEQTAENVREVARQMSLTWPRRREIGLYYRRGK